MQTQHFKTCPRCGATAQLADRACAQCGHLFRTQFWPPGQQPGPPPGGPAPPAFGGYPASHGQKSKVAAGVMGILIGWTGAHRFYLGYHVIGAIQLILTLLSPLTCFVTLYAAAVWGLVEGILILTGSIFTDAEGIPLRD
jgi:TM2 domain-containing membrane protein YozV